MSRTKFKEGYTKLSLAFREAVEEIRSVRTVPASSSGFRVSRFAALGFRVLGCSGFAPSGPSGIVGMCSWSGAPQKDTYRFNN